MNCGHILIKRLILKPRREFCSTTAIKKSVLISSSTDIYANLALEDWYYTNGDLKNENILMIWRNKPCVVIGKFQNPWKECNVNLLYREGISFARRNSGGGTVYHDLGNINLTFLTSRQKYDRKVNLTFISDVLKKNYNIDAMLSVRQDLTIHDKKISGTAAKVGRTHAYHHCTLLVNADRQKLHKSLNTDLYAPFHITTNASSSIPSPVTNLSDVTSSVNIDSLIDTLSNSYSEEIKVIEPREDIYPGVSDLRAQFASWDWNIGRTPLFNVTVSDYGVTVTVTKGIVTDVQCNDDDSRFVRRFASQIIGMPYDVHMLRDFIEIMELRKSKLEEK